MRKLAISTLTIVILLLSQIPATAQPNDNPMGKGMFGQHNIVKMLELTSEQEKQFNDINYKHQKETIDLHAQIQKNRLELKNIMLNKNFDEKKILALTDENSKLQADIKKSAVNKWIAVYKILNDEQKEKWAMHFEGFEPREKMREHMKERFKERRGF
ncbi:MAG: Spy/CpxP family protein refolding chaperone [Bacteroidota bacterium]